MARLADVTARSRRFLSHAVSSSRRGGCLSASTRSPLAGTDRAHADRLCARRLLARLVDTVGLSAPGFASSTAVGYDAYTHRVVFSLEGKLYGRSLSASAPPHRFLPGAKGGLY